MLRITWSFKLYELHDAPGPMSFLTVPIKMTRINLYIYRKKHRMSPAELEIQI
jgi:hypothetical protein